LNLHDVPGQVLSRAYGLEAVEIRSLTDGRINQTFLAATADGRRYALQRLNPFFEASEALGLNWRRVAEALAPSAVLCPTIVAARDGGWLASEAGGVWRLTTFLAGQAPSASPDDARAAGLALARCHAALNRPKPLELEPLPGHWEFTNQRLSRPADFELLTARYRGHPRLPQAAAELARGARAAGLLPGLPAFQRVFYARDLVVHLDAKRANFLHDGDQWAVIDWDTVGYGDPLLDLGEICRSFAFDQQKRRFDASTACAAVDGYRNGGFELEREQGRLLPTVVRGLAVNLARRYLTDALAEVYFKLDESRFSSLFEQNLDRAKLHLDLAEELHAREMELVNKL
jgi:Ser/Thr protein kinase RdoA (MazF antagonist)